MANQEEYKVRVKNLSKSFGDLKVLENCSFDIRKGEFVCVVGPTGCGKTTFLNLLTCLLEPTDGEILVDGERADPKKHNLAFVFQEASAFPWLTVEKNIRFGLEIKKHPAAYIGERVDTIIRLLGLEKHRHCETAAPGVRSVRSEQAGTGRPRFAERVPPGFRRNDGHDARNRL